MIPSWMQTEQEKLLARLVDVRASLEAACRERETDDYISEETEAEARDRMTETERAADDRFVQQRRPTGIWRKRRCWSGRVARQRRVGR